MTNNLFGSLMISGLLSTIFLSLVLILRRVFKEKISIKVLNFIWVIVLIRLLMPISLNSPVYFDEMFANRQNVPQIKIESDEIPEYDYETLVETHPDEIALSGNETPMEVVEASALQSFFQRIDWINKGLSLWLIGAGIFFIISLARINKFKRLVYNQSICINTKANQLIYEYKKLLEIDKTITLRESNHIKVPVIMGARMPILLMPKGFLNELDDSTLSMIILHEMCHIKSNDVLKNNLWLIAKALNWYNPLVYIGYHRFLDDMEKNCDKLVLECLECGGEISYFEALVNVIKLAKDSKTPASLLCFCRDKSKLRKRVDIMIKNQKPIKRVNTLIALLIITVTFLCFTTACTGRRYGYITTEYAPQATLVPLPTIAPTYYDPDEDGTLPEFTPPTLNENNQETPAPTPTAEPVFTVSAGEQPENSYYPITRIYDGYNPLSNDELEECNALEIRNIDSFEFLKDLDNIKLIYISSKHYSTVNGDISVLSTLKNLEEIRLYSSGVYGDINSLKNLTNLRALFIGNTAVTGDISSLTNLTYLRALDISESQVTGDIKALENMIYLEYVAFDETNVTGDIASLENCKMLEDVYMCATEVTGDIAVFTNHIYLDWVALENTNVYGDISAFSDCQNLRVIYLWGTQIEGDLSSLQDLNSIGQVDVGGTDVTGELYIPPERRNG